MSKEVFNQVVTVSLEDAVRLIVANPNVRYMLRGEPGIGKSCAQADDWIPTVHDGRTQPRLGRCVNASD